MIDTDKYEGHTPAPWMVCCEDSTLYARWIQADEKSVCSDLNDATEVDAQLIADAPLLLAEVKELRRQIKIAQGVFEYLYDDELEDAHWIRWFCNMEDEEE